MYANYDECIAAGLDPKEVERIAKGISRYAREAQKMGMEVFGGSGLGSLRESGDGDHGALVLAYLDGKFDGGCGATDDSYDGLLRGEY